MHRHDDGTVTVEHADPVIWVCEGLLEHVEPWALPDGTWETLQLDTAGEYRYRKVGPVPGPLGSEYSYLAYERIES